MIDRRTLVRRAAKMEFPPPSFSFGRHKGDSVERVLATDPSYIVWCWQNITRKYVLPFGKDVYDQALERVKYFENFDVDDDEFDELDFWAMSEH